MLNGTRRTDFSSARDAVGWATGTIRVGLEIERVSTYELDDVDKGILHALQENARDATIETMGEQVGVSASTVRNRINDMEEAGIIEGYYPQINYERAGYDLHLLYLCRAPTRDRGRLAKKVLDVSGVVGVHEVLDSTKNVFVEAVATDPDQMATAHDSLIEMGLDVRSVEYVRHTYTQPFDHFGADIVDETEP